MTHSQAHINSTTYLFGGRGGRAHGGVVGSLGLDDGGAVRKLCPDQRGVHPLHDHHGPWNGAPTGDRAAQWQERGPVPRPAKPRGRRRPAEQWQGGERMSP